jgi:mannose-6-phosphate isomerase-like protein (cupin superfamily)
VTAAPDIQLAALPDVHLAKLPDADRINSQLISAYRRVLDAGAARQTHHFFGRFENTYIGEDALPEVKPIARFALAAARQCLGAVHLRYGFWFNEMQPGHRTSLHSHEEDDEQLSAVYYVRAPHKSGRLCLHHGPAQVMITPQDGLLVLFPPETPHEVEENRAAGVRLSVAFNFGPPDAAH